MNNRYSTLILALLLSFGSLLSGIHGAFSAGVGNAAGNAVQVKKIYDGDTIGVVLDGRFEKIRLIGVDAPELDQRPWGRKARKYVESLVAGANSKISLEYDIERRDKYGRILAYIWIQDGRMLNEEMLKNGFAVLFTCPPNVKHVLRFRAAQEKARDNKIGIWGENGLRERPYDYRKEHPRR